MLRNCAVEFFSGIFLQFTCSFSFKMSITCYECRYHAMQSHSDTKQLWLHVNNIKNLIACLVMKCSLPSFLNYKDSTEAILLGKKDWNAFHLILSFARL